MPKTKIDWYKFICRTILVVLGTVLVAFGSVGFHVPLDINAGGLSGIGIIVRYFVPESVKVLTYNLVVTIASIILWLMGLIFIGKDFAFKTLVATIVFPGATWLFTTCPGVSDLMNGLGELLKTTGNGPTAGNYLLCSILTAIGYWNDYQTPFLYMPKKYQTLAVGLQQFQLENQTSYPMVFASMIISIIPILILYLIFQKRIIESTNAGGLKG